MPPKPQNEKKGRALSPSQRRAQLLPLGLGMLLLLALVFSQQAFNLHLIPDSAPQTLLLVALSALVFLLLVALSFVLMRNLLKLYAERRLGVLGSRFRSRMVIGALLLSFAPALTMFLFSYALMNRSIDKWFSGPVSQLQQDTDRLVALLSDYAGDNARREAIEIAREEDVRRALAAGDRSALWNELRDHEPTLQGGFVVVLARGDVVADWNAPQGWEILRGRLPDLNQLMQSPQKVKIGEIEYLMGLAPAGPSAHILVGMPLPQGYSPALDRWKQHQRTYQALGRESKRIRVLYVTLLLLLTVLVLFIATWLSLFVSKLVTRPVEALAEATREISVGHLGHRVEVSAADELGELVTSFNRMTTELESSRKKIEQSARALSDSNTELEQRRRHIETILESIPTGVLSLDPEKRVTHSNVAFVRMFHPENGAPAIGSTLRAIFAVDIAADLEHLLRRADRMGVVAAQFEIIAADKNKINASVTAASVQHRQQRLGYVIVFEDFSDLLKAQQEVAWREVARRVAHEIKNPLTPIALSADRIRRHLERGAAPEEASLSVIRGCAETITGAVHTVRSLVDEFATLARFPASQPRPADLNEIVEDALALFRGRLEGIYVQKRLDPILPLAMADPEAIKRAVANLIDNAAEATEHSLVKEIHIATSQAESKDALEITVADSGHGIDHEVKEKLFLPYVSTKKRGTGLGLAIVRRIMEDHHGSIRVEENHPSGAKFILEFPLAAKTAATAEILNA
jgi:nitrogen fixation/metabolism regulation signal transduction histidine kinase